MGGRPLDQPRHRSGGQRLHAGGDNVVLTAIRGSAREHAVGDIDDLPPMRTSVQIYPAR